jgi:heterotetrameric sarcosine oxidase delta subunit
MRASALTPGGTDVLLIPCPNCGERDESEFDYGGRAIALPALDASISDWHQALHLSSDTEDCIDENWYHAGGCECWIRVNRNLLSHEIGQFGAVKPEDRQ